MIRILFTRSNLIGSKLIRWGLEEPVSHTAIEYDGLVFHANHLGVIIEPIGHFTKHSTVVYLVDVPDPDGLTKLRRMTTKYWRAPYDGGSVAWLSIRALLKKIGIKLKKANLWNSSSMFICHEWVTQVLDGAEDSNTTPYQLYLRLKEKK